MAATCARCGATLEPGARFCGECGTPFAAPGVAPAAATPVAAVPAPNKHSRLGVALATAALMVVAAIFGPEWLVQQLPGPLASAVTQVRAWLSGGAGSEAPAPVAGDETLPQPLATDDASPPGPGDERHAATFDDPLSEKVELFVEEQLEDFVEGLESAAFLETPPAVVHIVQPEYPEESRRLGVQGTVLLLVFVDAAGSVVTAAAVEGPDEATQRAAEEAVQQWRYAPPGGDEGLVVFEVEIAFPPPSR